ncbi:iron ABC transporter permease [Acidithiobacillus caldus]|uniref:Iron ABC transporter permease n=1 Tax=Acidithiobacillus caldus TaxID=33059 RepID=A0A1E7YTZ8_9PROT|nr:iron ABC transporter permease [Acidithiobacillus caldus]
MSVRRYRGILRPLPVWLIILIFFVYPLGRFLLLPWFPHWAPESLGAASWPSDGWAALRNSVVLAIAAAGLAAALGTFWAWAMERRRSAWHPWSEAVLWLIFLMPSYLLTTGWEILFAAPILRHGFLHDGFYSPVGIIVLLAAKALPFAIFVVRPLWAALGHELTEAMRIFAVRPGRAVRVFLRLAIPVASAATVVSFIESVQEFGIPATLGAHLHLPILTYSIYAALSTSPLNFVGASRLALLLVVLAFSGALLQIVLQKRFGAVLVHAQVRHRLPARPKRSEALVIAAMNLVVGVLVLVLPMLAIVRSAFQGGVSALRMADWDPVLHSLGFALLAASLAILLAWLFARSLVSGGVGGRAMDVFSMGNMAVPGLVLGAAYIMAFNLPGFSLYGGSLLLILAYTAATAPMLTRLLQAPMAQLDRSLGDAARIHGVSAWVRWLDIDAALLSRPLVRGWLLAFGTVMFELPVSELLYPAGKTPLGVAVLALNNGEHFAAAARLALGGLASVALVTVVVLVLLRFALPDYRMAVTQ